MKVLDPSSHLTNESEDLRAAVTWNLVSPCSANSSQRPQRYLQPLTACRLPDSVHGQAEKSAWGIWKQTSSQGFTAY